MFTRVTVALLLLIACTACTTRVVTTDASGSFIPTIGTRFSIEGPDLPKPGQPIFMYGPNSEAKYMVDYTIARFLMRHGMMVVGPGRAIVRDEQRFILANDERITPGRLVGADIILVRSYSRELATVTVKGVSVKTGEVLFSGTASTVPDEKGRWWTPHGRTLRALTCQAMKAAFRLQPTGAREMTPEDAC